MPAATPRAETKGERTLLFVGIPTPAIIALNVAIHPTDALTAFLGTSFDRIQCLIRIEDLVALK